MTWRLFRRCAGAAKAPKSYRPALEALEQRQLLTTYPVTITADSGAGSLRQAIMDANGHSNAMNPGGVRDVISFNIAGAGPHTISLGSALEVIDEPLLIDGFTQPGSSRNTLSTGNNAVLKIELNGTGA